MTTEEDARSFLLGTFVDHSGVPFPAIVIADFAYPIRDLLRSTYHAQGKEPPLTMIDVMEGWENNWPALCTAATRLAEQPDPTGRPVGDLQTLAPIRPRQIICELSRARY